MGTLANWGAIAGAAKGFAAGAEENRQTEQHRLDQEREERLQQLRADREEAAATVRYGREKEMQSAEWGQQEKMTTAEQEFKKSQEQQKQEYEAGQGMLDRASREKIAGIEAASREKASGASKSNKWTSDKRTVQVPDPAGGLPIEKTVKTMTSPKSQITYVQKGDIWTWDESEDRPLPPVRPPKNKEAAEKDLLSNPTEGRIEKYMKTFGYLPLGIWAAVDKED